MLTRIETESHLARLAVDHREKLRQRIRQTASNLACRRVSAEV